MNISVPNEIPRLAEYGISESEVETNLDAMFDLLAKYGYINNEGKLGDPEPSSFNDSGMLDKEEKPGQGPREGESRLGLAYTDLSADYYGMIDPESICNDPDQVVLDLPEENRREAAGALFGASYALFRYQIMEEGVYPAEDSSLKQDINSPDERELFLEEGAFEIKGKLIGPWGREYDKMNNIVIDPEVALQVYNDTAQNLLGEDPLNGKDSKWR